LGFADGPKVRRTMKPTRLSEVRFCPRSVTHGLRSDGDGALSGSELDRAASLAAALDQVNKNQDAKITADEVTQRIQNWQETLVGLMTLVCHVTLDGRLRMVPARA